MVRDYKVGARLSDLAARYELSRERVSQIIHRAQRKEDDAFVGLSVRAYNALVNVGILPWGQWGQTPSAEELARAKVAVEAVSDEAIRKWKNVGRKTVAELRAWAGR